MATLRCLHTYGHVFRQACNLIPRITACGLHSTKCSQAKADFISCGAFRNGEHVLAVSLTRASRMQPSICIT